MMTYIMISSESEPTSIGDASLWCISALSTVRNDVNTVFPWVRDLFVN